MVHSGAMMVGFTPHTTHLFHPLDLVIFGVIKTTLKNPEHSDKVNIQAEFAEKLLQAFEKATTSANIRSTYAPT